METITTTDTSGANFKVAVALDLKSAGMLAGAMFAALFLALVGALVIYKNL